jgi:uroporphyrin-III C-methyltransferase
MTGHIGKVLLVGAGPGDPKLITVKGMEAIEHADVIVYDRLSNPELLKYAKGSAVSIYVGKTADKHTIPQEEINQLLVQHALAGREVVRLKGGDPSVFGRVGEEAEFCNEHGVPFEMVPGVTSGIAAPLWAGIPLTHRDINSSITFVTGHKRTDGRETEVNWTALAALETLVIYMGVGNLPFITEQLIAGGKKASTPVALIRCGTLPQQETLIGTLDTIVQQVQERAFKAPAIIVVGEVVRLRERLKWFEETGVMVK